MSAQGGDNFTIIALMMLVVGTGIPVTAALNAVVGTQTASPIAASAILFGLGFALTTLVLIFTGLPPLRAFSTVPFWSYAAVLGVFFYVISVTWSAPRIGVGNAIFFVLLGQLIAAATIDHFGLFGAIKTTLTAKRALGLLVMAIGVYLAKKPR